MRKMMFALAIVAGAIATLTTASAQRVWSLPDRGRNHGVVSGPGMPKCNPWVSEECRRAFPIAKNQNAASEGVPLAVKPATTLCAPVFYDGDTNHFFVPAIAFEAPAGISSTIAIDALNRDQPRKALASKDRAILGSGHRRPYPTLLIKPWRAVERG